jgi:2-haloacid dehalogenase
MAYRTVLFDLDHTLFDFDSAEAAAFAGALDGHVGDSNPSLLERYLAINAELWRRVELGELSPSYVRVARFEQLALAAGIDIDAAAVAERFADGLADHGELYPSARAVLEELAGHVQLAVVTNGLSQVQHRRIERLGIDKYFDAVVVSADVGFAKPAPQIFDIAFEILGNPSRATAVMIGDSLTSDVLGANRAGVAACWYNPRRVPVAADVTIHHEIDSLEQIPAIVRAG